jgi:hypothetical protein
MKFSIAAITGFVSAISAATLPSAFTLVAEGGKTVLTDGRTFNSGPQNSKIESQNTNNGDQSTLSSVPTPLTMRS